MFFFSRAIQNELFIAVRWSIPWTLKPILLCKQLRLSNFPYPRRRGECLLSVTHSILKSLNCPHNFLHFRQNKLSRPLCLSRCISKHKCNSFLHWLCSSFYKGCSGSGRIPLIGSLTDRRFLQLNYFLGTTSTKPNYLSLKLFPTNYCLSVAI